MAHSGLIRALGVLALVACGGTSAKHMQLPQPVEPPAFSVGARLQRFHSTRFGVSLPFSDGPHWRIDDHKTALLRASHEATQSHVEIVVWREEDLVNRAKCEQRAREKGFGERAGEEVDLEIAAVPAGWDTLVWLSAEHDETTATGHLFAFAASTRKCLYFHFSTHATAPADISDRLAFARLRMLGELRFDSFEVPREPRGNAPH